jgi:hypothetical protein
MTQPIGSVIGVIVRRERWGDRRDSNPQQPESQSGDLPLIYGHQPRPKLGMVRNTVKRPFLEQNPA